MAVTSTNNLRQGSKGSDVSELQELLNSTGNYNLEVDGSFGPKTLAAVKDYQSKNGLTVDGVVGTKTWGALTSGATKNTTGSNAGTTGAAKATATNNGQAATQSATPVTSPGGVTYGDFYYDSYTPSETVQQAEALLQQQIASKPGDYTPVWQDEADAYLSQYQNRDPFSYDFNSDALYQQYKDNYILQGQMAMMDTMGQAAAMTGGYGNSYAQTAGQQAYNQYLGQLNEIMPELYSMAYDRYNQEGQELLDMYNLYMNREAQERSNYQADLSNWFSMLDYYTDNYNTLYDREHSDWETGYNTAWDEYLTSRDEAFTAEQNAQSREFTASENDKDRAATEKANAKSDLINLITATGYEPTDSELEAAGMSRNQATAYKDAYTASLTSAGGDGGTEYTVLDYEEQAKWDKEFQKADSLAAVERVADRMEQAGVDPVIVGSWFDYYSASFIDEQTGGATGSGATGSGYGGSRSAFAVRMTV